MRVIARRTLLDFAANHADARSPLEAWYRLAKAAHWRNPADVRRDDPRASIVANDRVVFDIKGGSYRLVAAVRYDLGIVFIRFVGTHREYDAIDAATV